MDETYSTKAIILDRQPFSEDDARVVLYSFNHGKLELVARGAKKIKSKLAGHLEPFCLSDIMVVRGRRYDYVGGAVSEDCFGNIKNDLEKLTIAGRGASIFNKLVKANQADERLFMLLENFLRLLNSDELSSYAKASADKLVISYGLWLRVFILQLLSALGYKPELYRCALCHKKISPGGNKFNPAVGGVVCASCAMVKTDKHNLTISDGSIKVLRLISGSDVNKLIKINMSDQLGQEVIGLVDHFFNYHLN